MERGPTLAGVAQPEQKTMLRWRVGVHATCKWLAIVVNGCRAVGVNRVLSYLIYSDSGFNGIQEVTGSIPVSSTCFF